MIFIYQPYISLKSKHSAPINGFTRIALILLFILFLSSQQLYAKISDEKLQYLKNLLSENKLNELILVAEKLKINNQEEISLRALLFKAYLYGNFLVKAEEEITFIESRIKNSETIYLRALQIYHISQDSNKTLALLNTISEKRFAPPYLLASDIFLKKKQFTTTREQLELYRGLEGENNSWFFYYGKYLLSLFQYSGEQTISTKQIREHIDRYSKAFPANHKQMYLKAEYYATQEQFDYALQFIDKAIYLSFSKDKYLDKKLYYLYRSQRFRELIQLIDSSNSSNWENKKQAIHYWWIKSFVNFINFKKSDKLFTLANPNSIKLIVEPLKKILALNPENDPIRFFLEELIIINTGQQSPLRKSLADYHYNRSKLAHERARLSEVKFSLERMIALAPYEKQYREAYLEYLRFSKQYEHYHIEAQNYTTLFTNATQNLRILHQLAQQKIQESLSERYKIKDLLTTPELNVLLVYHQRNYKNSWSQPYLEEIVAKMLQTSLQNTPIANIDISTSKKLINNQKQYDYEIHFSVTNNGILTIKFTILNSSKIEIFNEQFSFYGKNQYTKMNTKWVELLHQILPKIGKVSAIQNRQAVITIGKIHGAKMGDYVQLYKDDSTTGTFALNIVDNYYSLITINKTFTLSKTEIGDRVVLIPSESESNRDSN